MARFQAFILLAFSLLVSLASARGEEPPLQEPKLRIEVGMHTALINRIDVSRDGKILVTGSDDKTVRLWSLPEGELLKTFRVPIGPGGEGKVYAVALSPDGRILAAGGADAHWRDPSKPEVFGYLFDAVSGTLTNRLGPLPDLILDLAFSQDGQRLAAGLWGKNGIRIWTAPFTKEPWEDTDYGGAVLDLVFDVAGMGRLAATSFDGKIRLYDGEFSRPPKRTQARSKEPYDIDFSPDGSTLAVGYYDTAKVDILSVAGLAWLHEVETRFAGNGDLSKVGWSADGTSLYAAGRYDDGSGNFPVIRWSDAGRGKPEPLDGRLNTVQDLAALPRGGVAFGASGPAFGLFGADGKQLLFQGPVTADMRGKVRGYFWSAPDAAGARFGLREWGEEPWCFDVARLSFEAAHKRPANYIEPITNTLPVKNWTDEARPTLSTHVLALLPYEISRSLAIAPDAKSFILGTEWSIYRFDSTGKKVWRNSTEGEAWGVNLSADGSIIVAAIGDGTIRWYRASDGAELLAFFVHVPDKRWIAWTPSGYYAASAGAEDLIGWHVNGKSWDEPVDFFPASRFRDRFYRPDIVQLVLKLKDEQRAIREANLRAKRQMEEESIRQILPAVVEIAADPRGIETDKQELTLSYSMRSPSGRAITKLEARIDGRPVQTRGVTVFDEGQNEITIPVPARDSEVSLIAWIDDQASAPANVKVKWTGVADSNKPNLYALLIGVSDYADPGLRLAYAAKDAADLSAAFETQEGRYYGNVETKLLLNAEASEENIEIELARLKTLATPNDHVVVFMAGHGVTDETFDFYFLPVEAKLDFLRLAATSIDGTIIQKALAKIPGKVVLFMDACRSGAGVATGRVDMDRLSNDFGQDSNGLVMFAAAKGKQDSLESSQWKNGAFTRALLDILSDPSAYGRDRKLSIPELEEELTVRVEELTEGRQNPVVTKAAAVPRFFLASLE